MKLWAAKGPCPPRTSFFKKDKKARIPGLRDVACAVHRRMGTCERHAGRRLWLSGGGGGSGERPPECTQGERKSHQHMEFWWFWSGRWCCWDAVDLLGGLSRAGQCIHVNVNGHRCMAVVLPIVRLQLTTSTIHASSRDLTSRGAIPPATVTNPCRVAICTRGKWCGGRFPRVVCVLLLCTFGSIPRIWEAETRSQSKYRNTIE